MEPTSQGPDQIQRRGAFRRVEHERLVAGVCAGIADYFDIDLVVVRVVAVALALLGGLAVPLYAAAWLLVPEERTDTSIAERLLAEFRSEPPWAHATATQWAAPPASPASPPPPGSPSSSASSAQAQAQAQRSDHVTAS